MSASQRSYIKIVKDLITEMEGKFGKVIPVLDIIKAAKEKEVDEERVAEVINKLKRAGDLFMPRQGFISKL